MIEKILRLRTITTDDVSSQLGRLLEASSVRRGLIAPKFLLLIFVFFASINIYFYTFPSPYVNEDVALFSLKIDVVLIILSIMMMATKNWFEKDVVLQTIAPYLYCSFFVISLMIRAALVGHLSLMTGVVYALAPLFALILFNVQLVFFMFVLGFVIFMLITALDYYSVIAYAPFFEPTVLQTTGGRLFYGIFSFIVVLPFYICLIGLAAVLISYWRKREDDVRRMSMTDSLIAMKNRRAISDCLAMAITENNLEGSPTSIILVDIDHFKVVNDTYGHQVGDTALCEIGDVLQQSIRGIGQVGRYGGEEFLIVLSAGQSEAILLAERCRENVKVAKVFDNKRNLVPVSASFGVYTSPLSQDGLDAMLREVDVQLYRAKEQGRNRVCY